MRTFILILAALVFGAPFAQAWEMNFHGITRSAVSSLDGLPCELKIRSRFEREVVESELKDLLKYDPATTAVRDHAAGRTTAAEMEAALAEFEATHLYYYATAKITRRRDDGSSKDVYVSPEMTIRSAHPNEQDWLSQLTLYTLWGERHDYYGRYGAPFFGYYGKSGLRFAKYSDQGSLKDLRLDVGIEADATRIAGFRHWIPIRYDGNLKYEPKKARKKEFICQRRDPNEINHKLRVRD